MQKVAKNTKKLSNSQITSFCYAGVLTVLAVIQLLKFDELVQLIAKNSGVGGGVAFVLVAMIVIFEVLALPYLVDLNTTRVIKTVSLLCLLMTGMFWVIAAFSTGLVSEATDIGALGTIIAIKPGAEAVVFSIVIASLSIFSCRKYLFK